MKTVKKLTKQSLQLILDLEANNVPKEIPDGDGEITAEQEEQQVHQ